MADPGARRNGHHSPEAAAHDRHEVELVAAFAVDDADVGDAERAKWLIDACAECARLATDLRAIQEATRASAGFSLAAPRDFRITPTQGARLRPASVLARLRDELVAGLAGARRPLGAGLATLGVLGLLVGSIGGGSFGAATAPGAGSIDTQVGGPGPSSGAQAFSTDDRLNAMTMPPPKAGETSEIAIEPTSATPPPAGAPSAGPAASRGREAVPTTPDAGGPAGPTSWVLAASGLAVALGVALLIWRPRPFVARR